MRQESPCCSNSRKAARLLAFVFIVLLGSVSGLWALAGADPDEAALLKARKTGVVLSQPHKILFTLKLPEHATQQAISRLKQEGFNAQGWITSGSNRILFATKTMVPEPATLQSVRRDLNSLLSSLVTEFERGWVSCEGWEILDLPQAGDDPDEIALLKARKAGINLAGPHKILFHLTFPWTPDNVAEEALRKAGFTATPSVVHANEGSKDGDQIFVLATKTMVPELATLQKVRRQLNSLIASLPNKEAKGRYHGWVISSYKPLDHIYATGLWAQPGRLLLFTEHRYPCAFEDPHPDPVRMFVSTDGGRTWKKGGPGLDGDKYKFLSQKDGKVWIVGEHTAEGPDMDPFIFVPSETGDHWQMRTIYQGNAALDHMAWGSKGELFAWIEYARLSDLTYGPAYIYQSLDGGRTWKTLDRASRHKVEVAEEFKKISAHMDPLWRVVNRTGGAAVQHRESEAAPWKTVWQSPSPPCQY